MPNSGIRGSLAGAVGLLAAAILGSGVASAQGVATHSVAPGDTLAGIALQYETSVSALAEENDIQNVDLIRVGRVLRIPGASGGGSGGGDDSDREATTYTVQAGDTLAGIAARYGTSVAVLAQSNRIANVDLIHVGQQIDIPGSGDTDGGNTDGGSTDDPAPVVDYTTDPVDMTGREGSGILEEVSIGEHDGFDRIVFEYAQDAGPIIELANGVPGYRVGYVESATECGSGFSVTADGSAMLRINLPGTYVYDPELGEPTLDSLEFTEDHQVIVSAEETCGFEGNSTWILGITSEQPYRIYELADPARLVVDVATD